MQMPALWEATVQPTQGWETCSWVPTVSLGPTGVLEGGKAKVGAESAAPLATPPRERSLFWDLEEPQRLLAGHTYLEAASVTPGSC